MSSTVLPQKRTFAVLGIETSCDDTCISVLQCDMHKGGKPKIIHSAIARSLDENEQYGGIHPIVAVQSHQKHMQSLVNEALKDIKSQGIQLDLVSVTKGPGMKASLQVGISAAEKLATDLAIPVLGVHHMQAHALTPRLLKDGPSPEFPYMSLLVSGGHTLLLKSQSVTDHEIIASTLDIAIGDCIDKIAKDLKVPWHGLMPGAALEVWCKDEELSTKDVYVPKTVSAELKKKFNIKVPLHAKVNVDGIRSDRMEFSFSGLGSSISRILKVMDLTEDEQRGLGAEAMKSAFDHVMEKVVAGLRLTKPQPNALVISGGVARNAYLRQIMQAGLKRAGFGGIELICPPLDLCSDNATMIAWTAFEMHQLQHKSQTPIMPRPKWPLTELLIQNEEEFSKILASRDKKQPHLPMKQPVAKKIKLSDTNM
ncbi:Glycoprotease pgp1 [Taphrina deformans PYCC 5710]|uniref:N(6)-L-threonylcarbamoyladenine synthase n=1 Tax=Taphrina deformans (strain PYCC 5710 / ATCC 11124 / CBS 356.35 / IMI 108563 / JCM 9778 / NBRC 8474) TaxID=1097556 RepID=R4X6E5_TAPDE|nr:Glycoprotease pgp1 [Taphrina deformans PYCC 5710]|eukprot:CCG80649.1 Glycoprotease pgp1 [Taphrina deformans PYCC 5710]